MLRLSLIFILFSIYTASLICAARGEAPRGPIRPLTQEFVTVYESPDARNLCCYSPGIARLDDGRLVAVGPAENASRHYASMAIDGDDLVVLSRSGDERAKSAHDGNLITFHRIRDFRSLVY